jgi:pimeloyl-ACP methyl ester carboxylesterase
VTRPGWRRFLVIVWLIALTGHLVITRSRPGPVSSGMEFIEIESGGQPVRLAWSDLHSEQESVVLFIHGSPGSADNFDQLVAEMPDSVRSLCVDLPGFGQSTRHLDDYSFTRHAHDLLQFLDALKLPRVHLVGMSMGGGVVLEMARLQPARVQSITLLSAIGFQEYELTGDYWTNRILHVSQAVVVWVVEHLVPHFGWLDSDGLAWSYVRNFLDSDQRVLRDTLLRWEGPSLVIHGDQDFLIPVAGAVAHSSALQGSRLEILEGRQHFLLWTQPRAVATILAGFIADSPVGGGRLAPRARPRSPLTPLTGPGLWILVAMTTVSAALIPSLASWWFLPFVLGGRISLPGFLFMLALGAFAQGAVRSRGGLRLFTSGGSTTATQVVIHALTLRFLADVVDLRSLVGLVVALAVWLLIGLCWHMRTPRSRGHLRGRWLRLRRWEYWPAWALYAPLVPPLMQRARQHGGLRVATCVNPAIPLGGLVGESKSEILAAMAGVPEVARWIRVDSGELPERRRVVELFAAELDSPWPLVLKPDRGERGAGVRIVRTAAAVGEVLSGISIPVIAQEYIAGVEYGVFWYRIPGENGGHVFSVSHKEPVTVQGDGIRTFEQLILANDRLLPVLDHQLDIHAARLGDVPAAGETVVVTELGTHSLGATFLDSMHLRTPELEAAIEEMMAPVADLDFGRFDIRSPSEADFSAGRGLRVLELNGLSAEAAHAYDPANGVAVARDILLEQWTLALRIGDLRAQSGVRKAGWWEIWRALRAHAADRAQRGG